MENGLTFTMKKISHKYDMIAFSAMIIVSLVIIAIGIIAIGIISVINTVSSWFKI